MKITDLVRWIKQYEDLPLIQPKPITVDDSDIDFNSDMAYCKDLLLEIQLQALATGMAERFPLVFTDELDHAITELAGIKARIREMNRG